MTNKTKLLSTISSIKLLLEGNHIEGGKLETLVDQALETLNSPEEDKEFLDVDGFQKKFDILTNSAPTMLTKRKLRERAACMQEELDEFKQATESQDFAEQADALIDIVYFAKGTASMMGLPWAELWNDVHSANMRKERGMTKRGFAVDMVKPPGWKKPDGEAILKKNGFDRSKFESAPGLINEDKCADDPMQVLKTKIRNLLSAANDIPIGDDMTNSIGLFSPLTGKILDVSYDNIDLTGIKDITYTAISKKFNKDELAIEHFKDENIGPFVHIYEILETGVIVDPVSFEPSQQYAVRYGIPDNTHADPSPLGE